MDTIELMNGTVLECFQKELERQKPKSEGQKMAPIGVVKLTNLERTEQSTSQTS